ncbi:MAG: hypothetical protein RLY72_1337 [Planctomycetota bacterium]
MINKIWRVLLVVVSDFLVLATLLMAALSTVALSTAAHGASFTQVAAQTEHLPRVLKRDLPLLDRVLSLDDAQRSIVEMLLEDAESMGATQEALVALRDNLSAVLSDSQRAQLPEVWRVIFRERMESAGAIGGEAVDLGALARALMRGATAENLDAAVAAYRVELDPLLDARTKAEGGDPIALLRIRLSIRTVNDRALDTIAAAIPEALVASFRSEALAKAYPSAFAPSAALSSLDRLLRELPTDELRALKTDAQLRYSEICTRGVAAIRQRDAARADSVDALAAAEEAVANAERAYDEFERWLLKRTAESAAAEALVATEAGKSILAQNKALEQAIEKGSEHPWTDQRATLMRFDANGDGSIDEAEGSAALTAFSQTVGRRQHKKL